MKRWIVVCCIALLLATFMSACSVKVPNQSGGDSATSDNNSNSNSGSSGQQGDTSKGGKEISIAINDSPWKPAVEKIVPLYEEQTGNKIKLHVFPYGGLYEKLVTASSMQSSEFDIVFMDAGWTPLLYSSGYITPIREVDPDFELDPAILEYGYFTRWNKEKNYPDANGELMSLPINGNLQLLYYRKDILEKLGVEAPKTWDDVLNIAKQVHDPGNGFYGFVTGGQTGNRVAYDFLPFLFSHGGSIFANPAEGDFTVTINNDAGKRAVRTWMTLMKEYGPPNIADVSQADVMSYLTTGKVAMGITVAAQYSFMDNPEYSVVLGQIDFVVPPAGEGGQPASVIGSWFMGIPKGSTNKEAALDFMKWATSYEVQREYAMAGSVPVRSDIYESDVADKQELRYLKAMKDAAKYSVPRPGITAYTQVEDIIGLYLNKALIGEMSGEEALDQIAAEASKVEIK